MSVIAFYLLCKFVFAIYRKVYHILYSKHRAEAIAMMPSCLTERQAA